MKRAAMSKNLVFTGLVAKSIQKMGVTMKRKKDLFFESFLN